MLGKLLGGAGPAQAGAALDQLRQCLTAADTTAHEALEAQEEIDRIEGSLRAGPGGREDRSDEGEGEEGDEEGYLFEHSGDELVEI